MSEQNAVHNELSLAQENAAIRSRVSVLEEEFALRMRDGASSRILIVRLLSSGIITRPKSPILRTIPVAFIDCLLVTILMNWKAYRYCLPQTGIYASVFWLKNQTECTAFSGFRFRFTSAVMQRHGLFDDCKSETGNAFSSALAIGIVALPDVLQIIRRNAAAVIGYFDQRGIVFAF